MQLSSPNRDLLGVLCKGLREKQEQSDKKYMQGERDRQENLKQVGGREDASDGGCLMWKRKYFVRLFLYAAY